MKNNFRKIFIALAVTLTLSVTFTAQAFANSMSSLDYHIELQEDGSGVITETRDMYLTEDTEIYIVMENLGGSEVTDFHVSDFGEPLTYEPDWDINASREEKAGKYGVVETSDGQELAWGIGEYGEHEYTITYTITDMVRQLEDGQGMSWQLFDGRDNINPEEVTMTITGPESFTTGDTRIWGFGFDGEVYLEDGELVGWSNESLSDSNHITILMQFLNEPFQPILSLDQTLSEQEDLATEGSTYNTSDGTGITLAIVIIGLVLVGVLIITIFGGSYKRAVKRANPLIKGRERQKLNEDQYYRDEPYKEGSVTDIAYLLKELGKGGMEPYFNAFMLKWLKEGHITLSHEETGRLFKSEKTSIQLEETPPFTDEFEKRFWEILESSANIQGVVTDSELNEWAQKNYKKIQDIDVDLPVKSKEKLIDNFYLEEVEVSYLGNLKAQVTKGTEKGEELFNHIVQFENYLKDFSLIDERRAKEVALWDDLLIWASLYGIAEQVAEQLKDFHPTYFEESNISYTNLYMMHIFSRNMSTGYSAGVNASSGGGGATSFGGGGGSFGGGGGGSR
ncbi:Predicted membrane protein [Pelagirhabdus alkalitolerans]|uniref:Predicted membrane protein n=1 Tax=Pelagirhabdus alkalitolerans TaxID=1612202 RepID=A0A1G6GRH4_9BACI|nr:DUF2207 domain-containing protein [Pelagirhabdus alkalitolerans]SDB84443.1 Predicted membrane protein [Pelagirhabdus alkalitolerans]